MNKEPAIQSFSKLNRTEKITVLAEQLHLHDDDIAMLQQFWFNGEQSQLNLEKISENVLSHYYLPFSIAPGFLINNTLYHVPMVTEESSVVAAASAAAKFWAANGGFKARVLDTTKVGQIHFFWPGTFQKLQLNINELINTLAKSSEPYMTNMSKRGGGLKGIELFDYSAKLPNYYQIRVYFNTADAMGANLINTCLEAMSVALKDYFSANFTGSEKNCDVLMSILSNHTPECVVECTVECSIHALAKISGSLTPENFANRFKQAVSVANVDIYRATTHNKGIFNGIDAVLLATGNDFRAVEAGGHSYAAKDGTYKSLTHVEVNNNIFRYSLKIPLAIGTVGGLTSIHPLVRIALKILKNPTAAELMQIVASAGLANNFSAIRALITSGIQQGHMKFHLHNILDNLQASDNEKLKATAYFSNKQVSHTAVESFIKKIRLQKV